MATISRDTFNQLNHYVSVRLQQGVPILDADWNEMDDIRRFELQAFLKWFVGNGVPAGNRGFLIEPAAAVVGNIVLSGKGLLSIDTGSTAATSLGLSATNGVSKIEGSKSEPFRLENDTTLIIHIDPLSPIQPPTQKTITFTSGDFGSIEAATATEVVNVINKVFPGIASVGSADDFLICGGDGTAEGAGRCLVEGWDVLNESDMRYQAQDLYINGALADVWHVAPLPPLTTPTSDRTDLVYLDIWEREVDAFEEPNLMNPAMGIPTCVRLKREWVVRVLEDWQDRIVPKSRRVPNGEQEIRKTGHVYYPLAQLHRKANQASIQQSMTVDLRRTGLVMSSTLDTEQIIADAYGAGYMLDNDGRPNLKISLRGAINALLRGGLPSSSPSLVKITRRTSAHNDRVATIQSKDGNLWIFYTDYLDGVARVWYKKLNTGSDSWGKEQQLTQTSDGYSNTNPLAVLDLHGTIWLFWCSTNGSTTPADPGACLRYKRYDSSSNIWGDTFALTSTFDPTKDTYQFALADSQSNIWLFWRRGDRDNPYWGNIWYRKFEGRLNTWGKEQQITSSAGVENESPVATEDSNGSIWLFWISRRSQNPGIYCCVYNQAEQKWSNEEQFTESSVHASPSVLCDQQSRIWVFWSDQTTIRCRIAGTLSETSLTMFSADYLHSFLDKNGDIWLFWSRSTPAGGYSNGYKMYSQDFGWGRDQQLVDSFSIDGYVTAQEDSEADIHVFWNKHSSSIAGSHREIWHKRLIHSL